jgi:hypothetical protein
VATMPASRHRTRWPLRSNHIPAGTPIWLRINVNGQGVLIAVEDEGPECPTNRRRPSSNPSDVALTPAQSAAQASACTSSPASASSTADAAGSKTAPNNGSRCREARRSRWPLRSCCSTVRWCLSGRAAQVSRRFATRSWPAERRGSRRDTFVPRVLLSLFAQEWIDVCVVDRPRSADRCEPERNSGGVRQQGRQALQEQSDGRRLPFRLARIDDPDPEDAE